MKNLKKNSLILIFLISIMSITGLSIDISSNVGFKLTSTNTTIMFSTNTSVDRIYLEDRLFSAINTSGNFSVSINSVSGSLDISIIKFNSTYENFTVNTTGNSQITINGLIPSSIYSVSINDQTNQFSSDLVGNLILNLNASTNKNIQTSFIRTLYVPQVSLASPINNSVVNNNNITLNCSAYDTVGINIVEIYLAPSESQLYLIQSIKTGGYNTTSVSLTFPLKEGAYKWNCRATNLDNISIFSIDDFSFTMVNSSSNNTQNVTIANTSNYTNMTPKNSSKNFYLDIQAFLKQGSVSIKNPDSGINERSSGTEESKTLENTNQTQNPNRSLIPYYIIIIIIVLLIVVGAVLLYTYKSGAFEILKLRSRK